MESIPGALYGRGVVKLEVMGLNFRSPPKLLFSHRMGPGLVYSLSSTNKLQIVSSRVWRLVKFYGKSGGEALGKSTEIELAGDAMVVLENVVSFVAMASNLTDDNVKNYGRGDKGAEKGFEEYIRGEEYSLESTKESLEDALKKLVHARKNCNMFEKKAQRISKMAITLRDEATEARKDVDDAIAMVQQLISEEIGAE
ncbi:hypothetical protein SUGI_1142060 [Cryptomeria japonica]|nr:hypothetical protein SUGI_1142060 [Cryptomeria japonica]